MFYAVHFDGTRIGVLDTDDNSIEYYTPLELKAIIKGNNIEIHGVTLAENVNPIYTLDGLEVNLYYYYNSPHCDLGRFQAVLLRSGTRWGRTFKTVINKDSIFFFDIKSKLDKKKYPSGQFIASYYAQSLLDFNPSSGLSLNNEVPEWRLSAKAVEKLQSWLGHKCS